MKSPKAFVSYSWESEGDRLWVRALASRLRTDGVDVTLDQWHAIPGDQLPEFMEKAVRENDHVLIICTPMYKAKSDARKGGVGYEGDIMTAEVFNTGNQRKFIPLLRCGEWSAAAPSWLVGKVYVDLRSEPYPEDRYDDLLSTLHGRRPAAPPLGVDPGSTAAGSKRCSPIAELAAIVDLLVSCVNSVEYVDYTFGESRRVIRVVERLARSLEVKMARLEDQLLPEIHQHLRRYVMLVKDYISEADFFLPRPSENGYTRDRKTFDKLNWQVRAEWEELRSELLLTPQDRANSAELLHSDTTIWQLIGFKNADACRQFISPRTETVLSAASPIELALLEYLILKDEVSFPELLAEGYTKPLIIETFNALMRDGYLVTNVGTTEWNTFRLTNVGRSILRAYLRTAELW